MQIPEQLCNKYRHIYSTAKARLPVEEVTPGQPLDPNYIESAADGVNVFIQYVPFTARQ